MQKISCSIWVLTIQTAVYRPFSFRLHIELQKDIVVTPVCHWKLPYQSLHLIVNDWRKDWHIIEKRNLRSGRSWFWIRPLPKTRDSSIGYQIYSIVCLDPLPVVEVWQQTLKTMSGLSEEYFCEGWYSSPFGSSAESVPNEDQLQNFLHRDWRTHLYRRVRLCFVKNIWNFFSKKKILEA